MRKPRFLLSFKELLVPQCVSSVDPNTRAIAGTQRSSAVSQMGLDFWLFKNEQMTVLISVSSTVESSRLCQPKI